ncbi:MAG TPA: hypothetical protein VKB27_17670 [Gammaproteobacteria bacterium]|nr:hypothetical protein [Gammaproteobacteria bacterium]
MIEPFFFDNAQLFGCYHPSADPASTRGVVFCPPLFDEYRRSYRALSDLANACAKNGVHVMRFDFYGTGDSQGMLAEASVGRWRNDIDTAIEELISLAGVETIVMSGVRFGATLASNVSHAAVKRAVFWDPVESGGQYLDWLDRANEQFRQEHVEISRYTGYGFDDIVYENFHLPEQLKEGLSGLKLVTEYGTPPAPIQVITSQKEIAESHRFEHCDYPGVEHDWPYYFDGLLAPKPVLEQIAEKVVGA